MEEYPYLLGQGLEGIVTHIAPNLVCKEWRRNWAGEHSLESIINRIKAVHEKINNFPEDIRKFVAVPEFVGYEKRKGCIGITYHEYIAHDVVIPQNILNLENTLNTYFSDAIMGSNVKYFRNKLYLIDVWVQEAVYEAL